MLLVVRGSWAVIPEEVMAGEIEVYGPLRFNPAMAFMWWSQYPHTDHRARALSIILKALSGLGRPARHSVGLYLTSDMSKALHLPEHADYVRSITEEDAKPLLQAAAVAAVGRLNHREATRLVKEHGYNHVVAEH